MSRKKQKTTRNLLLEADFFFYVKNKNGKMIKIKDLKEINFQKENKDVK